MIKLLVQQKNDKFINNIALSSLDFCSKLVTNIDNQLYKIYYKYQFTDCIFIASLLNNEINQFILEFSKDVNIFIYNDTHSNIPYNKNIRAVIQKEKNESKNKIISIPKLVNNEIFYMDSSVQKNYQIISFLDSMESMPMELNQFLYPVSNLPIKLFNNKNIIHPQNLGLLLEKDKASLLQQSEYYLALEEDYVPEAWACGSKVLTVEDLVSLEPKKFKSSKNFQSYSNFLKVLLSDKK
jgi:hypothetical protein